MCTKPICIEYLTLTDHSICWIIYIIYIYSHFPKKIIVLFQKFKNKSIIALFIQLQLIVATARFLICTHNLINMYLIF